MNVWDDGLKWIWERNMERKFWPFIIICNLKGHVLILEIQ